MSLFFEEGNAWSSLLVAPLGLSNFLFFSLQPQLSFVRFARTTSDGVVYAFSCFWSGHLASKMPLVRRTPFSQSVIGNAYR